jgi:hypothetical protein
MIAAYNHTGGRFQVSGFRQGQDPTKNWCRGNPTIVTRLTIRAGKLVATLFWTIHLRFSILVDTWTIPHKIGTEPTHLL